MHTQPSEHLSKTKDGNRVIYGFIVDADAIGSQRFPEYCCYSIKGAAFTGAGDDSRYLPAGVRPIPDKVKGIGRLIIPSAFQQDLDAGDGPGLLFQRSDTAEPFLIADIRTVVYDRGPAVTGVDVTIFMDIETGKHYSVKTGLPQIGIGGIVAGIEAAAKQGEARIGWCNGRVLSGAGGGGWRKGYWWTGTAGTYWWAGTAGGG